MAVMPADSRAMSAAYAAFGHHVTVRGRRSGKWGDLVI